MSSIKDLLKETRQRQADLQEADRGLTEKILPLRKMQEEISYRLHTNGWFLEKLQEAEILLRKSPPQVWKIQKDLREAQAELRDPEISVRRHRELSITVDRYRKELHDNCKHPIVLHYEGYQYGEDWESEQSVCAVCDLFEHARITLLEPCEGRLIRKMTRQSLEEFRRNQPDLRTLLHPKIAKLLDPP